MRWPPWKPHPDEVRARKEAERGLELLRAQRPVVEAAAAALERSLARNHLIEKAFALRERGDR